MRLCHAEARCLGRSIWPGVWAEASGAWLAPKHLACPHETLRWPPLTATSASRPAQGDNFPTLVMLRPDVWAEASGALLAPKHLSCRSETLRCLPQTAKAAFGPAQGDSWPQGPALVPSDGQIKYPDPLRATGAPVQSRTSWWGADAAGAPPGPSNPSMVPERTSRPWVKSPWLEVSFRVTRHSAGAFLKAPNKALK